MTAASRLDRDAAALPVVMDLSLAETLYRTVEELLAAGGPVRLDASGVERLSTACVQVLLAGHAAAARRQMQFAIEMPSAAFLETLSDLGVTQQLGL